MDWRRALLWVGLATVVTAAVLLIARVSVMTFRAHSAVPDVVAPPPHSGVDKVPAEPPAPPPAR